MFKLSRLKRKIVDNILGFTGALLGGAAFWLSMACIFYFDSWPERIISILIVAFVIYVLAKWLNRFHPR